MNIKLLKRVRAAILKHPKQFEMNAFYTTTLAINGRLVKAECGAAACIAGWAAFLASGKKKLPSNGPIQTWDTARNLLEIKEGGPLFDKSYWPEPFRSGYLNAKTPLQRARAAAKRIDYFIKEGK